MMIQKLVSRLSVLGLLIILPHILHAAQLDTWHWRNPLPQGNTLEAVVYRDGTFVAVGAAGTVLISDDDGESWTFRASGTDDWLRDITYGNGTFVAVGWGGAVLTSNDGGVTWTSRISGTTEGLGAITYVNGTFVVVGGGGTVLTSADGVTWTPMTSGTDKDLEGVTYGNGVFVAVGYPGTVVTSADGVHWTPRNSGIDKWLDAITYSNDTFVAVGQKGTIRTSSDGVTWISRFSGTDHWLQDITYGNGTFVAVGDQDAILTSADGATWTLRTSGTTYSMYGIRYGGGNFVAVGWNGAILTSADGLSWTSRISGARDYLDGIAYGNGTFVAVGFDGAILTSQDDAVTWKERTSGTAKGLYGVTYGNNTFVAVGSYGTILTSNDDGVTWTPRALGTHEFLILNEITYGNGTFAAVGENDVIFTSNDDGVTWTRRASGTDVDLDGVTYGNGTFVAVGGHSAILTSQDDGVTWTPRASGTDLFLHRVTYGNGAFVAVGWDGAILTSHDDGVTWTPRASGTDRSLNGVIYAHDSFVAVGNGGVILTSQDDGVTWTFRISGTNHDLNGVTYDNGTFVAAGYGGTILQSDSFAPPISHTLTVTRAGTGSGTVTSNPAGINCGSDCSETYDPGTSVTLTPAPDSGSIFTGWSGACSGTGACTVNMTSNKAVTATFTQQPQEQYSLTLIKSGTGSGTVTSSPAGINCGSDCSETYSKVQKVKLTAKADANSTFTGWSGGGCSGTKTCTVMVDTAVTVTADFALKIPDISVAQTSVDFSSVKLGKKATKTLKIMNNGTGDLSITLSGLEGTDFSIQGSSSVTIKAKKSYSLKVLFTPKSAGLQTAAVTITSNDPDTPELNIALSGSTVEQPQQYTLTVTKAGTGSGTVDSNPAGINCGADCSEAYNQGTSVTLTATPDSGSTFTGWSGACSGTGLCIINMTSDKAATATFAQQQYTLTVTKAGTGSGTVTSSPSGINCGADCSETYNQGTSVTLTATPDSGSTFTGWSGACSGSGACIVSMTSDRAATAAFAQQQYTLTVTKAGTGSGTVTSNPAGINCGADCSEVYNHGTSVTLTATPDSGSTFTGWSGECSGTGACIVSMTSDKAVTATFAQQQYTLTVTKAGTGSGTVASNPAGINCGADCSEVYNQGTSVTLTPTPDSGSTFTGWSGACSGTGACIVSMTSDKAATAAFTVSYDGTWNGITSQGKEFSLTVSNNGIASVKWGISCAFVDISSTTEFTPPSQITGNTFSVGGIMVGIWDGITIRMHTVTINGTFNSPTSASGNLGISGTVCSTSVTWNATK